MSPRDFSVTEFVADRLSREDVPDKKAKKWPKHPQHWYVEEERVTAALLTVEGPEGIVWDPACGGGNIVRACLAAGLDARGTDIVERVPGATWFAGRHDFLGPDGAAPPFPFGASDGRAADAILCNPPYFGASGAEGFIRAACRAQPRLIAMWLDLRFLASSTRATGLFQTLRPARVWFCWPRVSCPPGDYLAAGGQRGGGQQDWIWMVWERRPDGGFRAAETRCDWLDVRDGAAMQGALDLGGGAP